MQPFSNRIPVQDEKPSPATIKVLKDIAMKHKINLDYWIKSNGKTWDTLTALEAGAMLNSIKAKYGDDECGAQDR